jgi:uncharacterized protein YbbC (DUF1343 family)
MKVLSGLDVVERKQFENLFGKNIGLLCHQASVNQRYIHIIDLLLPLHKNNKLRIKGIFGPQHGLWGYTQENMIEWEGYQDLRTGLMIYSLYGQTRKPSQNMLTDIDIFVVDLQDIGARYYTFIWTMALLFESCAEQEIPVMVLDRINPINGSQIDGTLLDMNYRSFVGYLPLTMRHGMTIGEIAKYFQEEFYSDLHLQVVRLENWNRMFYFPDTGSPWVMPSPNIPHWESCLVYPGMCLLEGTNLSEGRGTTRPFEIFGAPWIDGWMLASRMNQLKLPGIYFRPLQFLPTFHKYKDEICEGAFLHITDRMSFKPVLTAVALLGEICRLYPHHFKWKNPPYEFEYEKMPFDILAGNMWLREYIINYKPLREIQEKMDQELREFKRIAENYTIYE